MQRCLDDASNAMRVRRNIVEPTYRGGVGPRRARRPLRCAGEEISEEISMAETAAGRLALSPTIGPDS
jgi:hypothetical protein